MIPARQAFRRMVNDGFLGTTFDVRALLDIGMPRLNGYDACRRIREQPWGKNIVMVALTGWGQDDNRRKSKDAGFDHHMVKPVDFTVLMGLLAGLKGTPV